MKSKQLVVKENQLTFKQLISSIQETDRYFAGQASRAVNVSLTLRNWVIGYYISEFELNGRDRAKYGESLLSEVAKALEKHKISNVGKRQLYDYVKLFRMYPQIVRTVSAQFNTYVSWFRKNMMAEGDNPPIGILLCTKKNHALVEYALAGMSNKLFVSKYQVELPKKREIEKFIEATLRKAEF